MGVPHKGFRQLNIRIFGRGPPLSSHHLSLPMYSISSINPRAIITPIMNRLVIALLIAEYPEVELHVPIEGTLTLALR